MNLKQEEKLILPTQINVCSMCLSIDRRTYNVESVSHAYGLMTDCAPQDGTQVCWECRALLARMLRFKVQALRAKDLLEAANLNFDGECVFSGRSMSQLTVSTSSDFTAEFAFCEPLPDFCSSPRTPDIKEEPSLSDYEVWAEAITEAEPEVEVKEEELQRRRKRVKSEATKWEVEVKQEEPQKKRKSVKSEVNVTEIAKSEVPVNLKEEDSEVKGRRKSKDDAVESFVATEAELMEYRKSLSSQMRAFKFMCKTCIMGFKYKVNLDRHNDQCHSETLGSFVCEICESRFPAGETLQRHRDWHRTLYRCRYPECNFMHQRVTVVRTHSSLHPNRERAEEWRREQDLYKQEHRFECDQCGKVFKQRRQVMVHIKHHNKKIMCELCAYKCSTMSQLRKHTLAHLAPSHRPYECEQCHKRFIDRHKLLLHTRTHTGERPFKCDTCNGEFVSKECLTRHVKDRHASADVLVKRTFAQPRTKSFFINSRHSIDEDRPKRQYRIVRDAGTNFYECSVCQKKILTLGAFQKHFYQVHTGRKQLSCEECNRTFKFHSLLVRHVSVTHRGEKPHQCNICGARFASKPVLQVHMSSHSSEKPFKCDECSLTFKYKAGLWSHKLIHKGEKPHQCNICGARFTLRGNLVGHMKTHTNDRPFECEVCGRKFPWKRNLKNHFKTHSKEQLIIRMS